MAECHFAAINEVKSSKEKLSLRIDLKLRGETMKEATEIDKDLLKEPATDANSETSDLDEEFLTSLILERYNVSDDCKVFTHKATGKTIVVDAV